MVARGQGRGCAGGATLQGSGRGDRTGFMVTEWLCILTAVGSQVGSDP